jgi:hypothetical protein
VHREQVLTLLCHTGYSSGQDRTLRRCPGASTLVRAQQLQSFTCTNLSGYFQVKPEHALYSELRCLVVADSVDLSDLEREYPALRLQHQRPPASGSRYSSQALSPNVDCSGSRLNWSKSVSAGQSKNCSSTGEHDLTSQEQTAMTATKGGKALSGIFKLSNKLKMEDQLLVHSTLNNTSHLRISSHTNVSEEILETFVEGKNAKEVSLDTGKNRDNRSCLAKEQGNYIIGDLIFLKQGMVGREEVASIPVPDVILKAKEVPVKTRKKVMVKDSVPEEENCGWIVHLNNKVDNLMQFKKLKQNISSAEQNSVTTQKYTVFNIIALTLTVYFSRFEKCFQLAIASLQLCTQLSPTAAFSTLGPLILVSRSYKHEVLFIYNIAMSLSLFDSVCFRHL